MDHSNANNWLHSAFEPSQPIHQSANPHLDDQSVTSPITQYRAHPPVNHPQFQTTHHPPSNVAEFSSAAFSQLPIGPFPRNAADPDWIHWDPSAMVGGPEGYAIYAASQAGHAPYDNSGAIDAYGSDPMAGWRPTLEEQQSAGSIERRASEAQPGPVYTAFSAFLHSASPNPGPSHSTATSTQHSPACSPLHQTIPLTHSSPPAVANQANRLHSYRGSSVSQPGPSPAPNARPGFSTSYTPIGSPIRPGVQYHTEPTRRTSQSLSARSMPADWQATYVHSLNEQRVRAQSTSHVPLLTGTPVEWTMTPGRALQHPVGGFKPESFSFLGLNLGAEQTISGDLPGSSLSDGGMGDRAPGLVPADEWQHQTVPPTDYSAGLFAGRFDNETLRPSPAEVAGPSSSQYDSPGVGSKLESLDLAPSYSPTSRGSSQLSTPKSALQTSFTAYDPAAPSTDGRKVRVPRRKPNEPPRNPNMRRYPCPLCIVTPRTFARPSALKIHMLTHTKEKRESRTGLVFVLLWR